MITTHERKVTQLVNINNGTNHLDKKTIQDNWTNNTNTTADDTIQYDTREQQVFINNTSVVNSMLICVNRYASLDVVIPCDECI